MFLGDDKAVVNWERYYSMFISQPLHRFKDHFALKELELAPASDGVLLRVQRQRYLL